MASRIFRTHYVLMFLVVLYASAAFAEDPDVIKSSFHSVSPPLSQMAGGNSISSGSGSNSQTPTARATRLPFSNPNSDAVAAPFAGPISGVTQGLNFEGQSADDNRAAALNEYGFGFAFVPPDTNGAVGNKQYVQIVNVTLAVYDKSTGNRVLGPMFIHHLWDSIPGSLCQAGGATPLYADGGDPVVLFDHLANRWLISQLQYNTSFTQTAQCVAISTSSDATGSYNLYEFDYGSNFPDYPKWAVWPDAYYNTVNIFPPKGFAGARACAFDRNAMLAGADIATAICYQQPPSVSSLLPSDLDGSTLPPAGSPNYLVGLADSSDLYLFKFHSGFADGSAPTLTYTKVPVAPFNEICARGTDLACIPEPPPGERVDALSDRVMFRFAYRNFGDHESLVVNHTIKGGALAGVRWYEIRNPGTSPTVYQQSTLVDPDVNYWLGSIAMDATGNIALGFSASSQGQYPSVWAGVHPASEGNDGKMLGPLMIINGTGVQIQSYKRWGDYSSMTVDPKDDCTFWYTNEYYRTTGSFDWTTRIGSFKFSTCKSGGR